MNEQTLLLDTHAWIWYLLGSDELRDEKILKSIESAAASSRLFVSSITLCETAMLVTKRRLALSIDTLDWMRTGLRETGMQVLEITPEIAVESSSLPPLFHGDPADRIIVASARVRNCTIVTRDQKIVAYAREGYCRILTV